MLVAVCLLASVAAAQVPDAAWSADELAARIADAWRWRDLPLPDGAHARRVTALPDGTLLVETGDDVFTFDGTTWTPGADIAQADDVGPLSGAVGRHGVRVSVTVPRALYITDGTSERTVSELPGAGRVVDVAWTAGDRLAFVMLSGRLRLCDVGSRRWTRFDPSPALGTVVVDALAPARDGGLWIGTPRGVGLLRDGRVVRVLEVPREFSAAGETLAIVTALHEDARGHLWVGSGSGFVGVLEFAPDGARWHRHPDGTRDFCVHAIDATRDGALWFSLLSRGARVRTEAGGVARLHDGTWTSWDSDDGLPNARAYTIAEAPDGTVVAGTAGRAARFDGERWTTLPGPLGDVKQIRDAVFDGDTLWATFRSEGSGVVRAIWRDGAPTDVERWDAPLAETVAPDGTGGAWVSTQLGLYHVVDGGLTAVSSITDALWPILRADDALWIGSKRGLLRLVPDDVLPPTIVDVSPTWSDEHDRLLLDVDARDPWSETPTEQLLASWRVGDGPWARPQSIGTALEIGGLAPGMQRISVRASDAYGNVSPEPSVVWVDVESPWFLTRPALVAAALTLVGLVALGDERRRRRADRERDRRELLEALERERGLIAHEIHDGLGRLVRVAEADIDRAGATDDDETRKQLLSHAYTTCRTAAERMHDLSTRLRPRVLDDLGLRDALATEFDVFAARLGARVDVDLDEDLDALPTTTASQVFRIVLETLAGIERSATDVSRLDVSARLVGDRFVVTIEDDGRRRGGARGVEHDVTRERAESLGGRLRAESGDERGRRVECVVPLDVAKAAP